MQRRRTALTIAIGIVLVLASNAAMAQYILTNLVANQAGLAVHTDPLLVNAWGLAHGPTSFFWVSDEGTGWSTLYSGTGKKQSLQVVIPSMSGQGPGSPTGVVFNGSQDFWVQGWPAIFMFATLDGTISGWAPQVNLNAANIVARSPGSVYTGLAITNRTTGNFLFAADNANNKVDVYDGSFALVKSFTDATVPAGFAPFGIQDIDGLLFVSFADQSGGTGGVVDIYGEDGVFLKQVTSGYPLNQPWGFAAAPKNFGPLSNTLLVANNTNSSSTINAFNVLNGQLVGTVKDTSGLPIKIDQLWGIDFGGGTSNNGDKNVLYFTAGPANNVAGTLGRISPAP